MFRHPILLPAMLFALAATTAQAQAPAPKPAAPPAAATATATATAADYVITGFRGARFGMTQAQVRAAAAADFPGAVLSDTANPLEGTQALQAIVPKLEPGPGAATVIYIFGASSKTLAHINVVWSVAGEPTTDQRASIVTAAVQLTNYFQGLPTPPKATAGVTPTGPNGLLMYAAVDKKGGGIEIAADGISYQTSGPDAAASAPPKGPAVLRVSYLANVLNPDVL